MRRGAATALLGLGFLLVAAVFDAEPLYVPGVAFVALAGGSAFWVWAGARGLRLTRTVGARHVLEEERVTIDVQVTAGRLHQEEVHEFRVILNPDVLKRLKEEDEDLLIELERRYASKLMFRGDPTFHHEKFAITDASNGAELKA